MKGITFGTWHTWNDFSLVLSPGYSIPAPNVKTETIDIPGADGNLDLTDYFGEPKYQNRAFSFTFTSILPRSDFWDSFSQIQNLLHGKRMKIVIDEDSGFYWMGRVSVKEWKADKNIGSITIDVDAEPYKYKTYKTTISATLTGTELTMAYPNLRKSVVPTFTASGAVTIAFGTSQWVYTAGGTFVIPELQFAAGNNIVTYTAAAGTTISVEYQEGGL